MYFVQLEDSYGERKLATIEAADLDSAYNLAEEQLADCWIDQVWAVDAGCYKVVDI